MEVVEVEAVRGLLAGDGAAVALRLANELLDQADELAPIL